MIAAIYCRVSTKDQAEQGYSLPEQIRECREKALSLGATIVDVYAEDSSGAFLERPELEKLRVALSEKRYSLVVVYDPDRLARNLTHQLILTDEIEKSGAQLAFVNFEWQDTPEGRLFYSIRGAVSAYEREKIRERVMRGKRGKALAGKIVINNRPFGFDFDEQNSIYRPNKDEAEVIKKMCKWVLEEGMGTVSIAKRLAETGVPTKKGKGIWYASSVYRTLTNELIAGTAWAFKVRKRKVSANKTEKVKRPEEQWIPISVEPIISRETFEAVKERLHQNMRQAKRNLKNQYLLRGVLFCPLCGRKMLVGESPRDVKNGYYLCPTGRSMDRRFSVEGIEKCPARRIPVTLLDEMVWEYIKRLIKNPSLIRSEVAATSEANIIDVSKKITGQILEFTTQEERLIKERQKVTLLFRQDLIPQEEAEAQLTEIKNRLLHIQSERKRLESELSCLKPTDTVNLERLLLELTEGIDDATFEVKKNIIAILVDCVYARRTDNFWGRQSKATIEYEVIFKRF